MNELWRLICDGEEMYCVYCEEEALTDMKNAFLIWNHPLNEPVTCNITFEKVDPNDYEVFQTPYN